MKKTDSIRWGRSLAITGVMILLIVAASFGVIRYINQIEEEASFEQLYEEAGRLADSIEMYAANDREELQMLAAVIAGYEAFDSPALWELLDSYTTVGMMSRIELLLPDDTVLVHGGTRVDASGVLSFGQEAALGAHITDRETDLLDRSNYVVRHYVPVIRNGETAALLCGVIELGELPEEVNLAAYGGRGAVYIIDGTTENFLVDTWHPGETGNMWALGEREMAPGYDAEQLRQGVFNGESRFVVFVSRTVGEYLYFYYEPMAINEWRIAVSVPESVVFESANAIARILNIFLLFELLCFVAYFLWMIRYARQVTGEKQRRLEALNNLYDVESLLFNAHEKSGNLRAALEKIGEILAADKVGFRIVGQPYAAASHLWEKDCPAPEPSAHGPQVVGLECLLAYFQAGNREFEAHDAAALRAMFPQDDLTGIRTVMAARVEDTDGQLCGILGCCNAQDGNAAAVLLRNLTFSFSMFCRNLKLYSEIREQGDRDTLTGLYNRNRYERDLPRLWAEHGDALACVYIDVNGLHEMNNTQGHEKGDKMLRTVAEGIRAYFDTEYAYRTGGDEFVLLIPDESGTDLTARCGELAASLEVQDYHISAGIASESTADSISALIKEAEKKMYEAKRRYYEQASHDRRRRARE